MSGSSNIGSCTRRGTVLVAVLIALIILSLVVFAMTTMGARDADLSVLRIQGARAEFAADAAANMAVKEMMDNVDQDGDGGIGTISNDGNTANDPTINNGTRMWATRSDNAGVTTLTARASNADASRAIQVTVTPGAGSSGAPRLFFTRSASPAVLRSAFDTATSTWAAPTTSGTVALEPIWAQAVTMDTSTLVLASNSGNGLYAGVADATGVATYSSISSNLGTASSAPFAATVEGRTRRGVLGYFDKSANVARFRTVSGTAISPAADIGVPVNVAPHFSTVDIPWMRAVSLSPSSDEAMVFTTHSCGCIWAARWTGSAWTAHTHMSGAAIDVNYPGVDAAVEAISGRMMMVARDTTSGRVGFRVFTPGSGWSGLNYRTGFGGSVAWVRLAAVPGSNDLFLVTHASGTSVRASHWNGNSWSSPVIMGTGAPLAARGCDVAVSPDGSTIMVMYGKGTASVFYRLWTGSAWSAEATAFTLSSGTHRTIVARPGPSGGMLVGAVGDSNGGVNAWSWNGTSFGAVNRVGTTNSSHANREWFAIPVRRSDQAKPTITSWTSVDPATP